jgi:hypothetical protein
MEKVRLRSMLKKLRKIPFDRTDPANAAMAPQEMLDILAMVAGIKPVSLLGRGFNDARWVEGARAIACASGLHVIPGPEWSAQPPNEGLPDWYGSVRALADSLANTVFYICKAKALAEEVAECCDSNRITIEQEARLLGYPPCCVQDHYRRQKLFNRAFALMLERTAGGDSAEMQRIVREDVQMSPQTPEEIAALREAVGFVFAPFTSFTMCDSCINDRTSLARRISGHYRALAAAIDPLLVQEIAANERYRPESRS